MALEVGLYEDWMKPQVSKLFSLQYKVSEKEFSDLISNFYELPFQKNRCIRIVAKEKDVVVGFQSFFYWPYQYNGQLFNSYQSGNSLVHPDFRGKGVFQKLLNYLDNHKEELKIDFLIGFPIEVSIGSLLRNNWKNIFNLTWYIKIQNIFSIFNSYNSTLLKQEFPFSNFHCKTDTNSIRIENSKEFSDWRSTHYDKEKYFTFQFSDEQHSMNLKLKINFRKKFIKELIIGDIITTTYDTVFLTKAFNLFFAKIKNVKCITLVSIALNDNNNNGLVAGLLKLGFKKINQKIYFCVKQFSNIDAVIDSTKWVLYRGDIDTW